MSDTVSYWSFLSGGYASGKCITCQDYLILDKENTEINHSWSAMSKAIWSK